jgi:hypothetical protein
VVEFLPSVDILDDDVHVEAIAGEEAMEVETEVGLEPFDRVIEVAFGPRRCVIT